MQVLKVIRTACMSIDVETTPDDEVSFETVVTRVNGQSLMLCVRSCYHIYLGCRDAHTQSLAHSALTDTQDRVMEAMELAARQLRDGQKELEMSTELAAPPLPLDQPEPAQELVTNLIQSIVQKVVNDVMLRGHCF
jgi:hypothetical protein